jgi:hypothetical protein
MIYQIVPENVQYLIDAIESKVPYFSACYSSLGGVENASILLTISLDPKETWAHGIRENSRLTHFSIGSDGRVEQFKAFYSVYGLKKFRRTRASNFTEAVAKVAKYLDNVIQESTKQ